MAEENAESHGQEYSQQFEKKRKDWVRESEQVREEQIMLKQPSVSGGSSKEEGDTTIKMNTFTQSRISEMVSVAEHLSIALGGRRIFQTLPPHMRRRAMSHAPKRVPRRIREIHQREVEKNEKITPCKRPSRKHRRRPKNLLQEYNRRKQNHVWLETHIWHAKRFKMDHLWGYNVPIHPRDKSLRAAHRSIAGKTLLQDISFYCCIELCGFQEEIVRGFQHLTNSEVALTPGAKSLLAGTRQGSGILYHKDTYPSAAIGPYQFHWKPCVINTVDSPTDKRTLWLWVHPACHDEVVKEFELVFKLSPLTAIKRPFPDVTDSVGKRASKKMKTLSGDRIKSKECAFSDKNNKLDTGGELTVNNPVQSYCAVGGGNGLMNFNDRTPVYSSTSLTMTLLKDTLVRFRLRGPQCIATLASALKVADLSPDVTTELQSDDVNIDSTSWWKNSFATKSNMAVAQIQNATWEQVQKEVDVAQLPPNCILGLIVRDPRLSLPSKRTEARSDCFRDPAQTVIRNFPPEVSCSPLWEPAIRDEVTYKRVDVATLNWMKSQSLVPGTPLDLGPQESRIPIMLVQYPGNTSACRNARPGYGLGFDLILPSGWGMAFWIALVYNGARASGIREAESTEMQEGKPVFPNQFPDTAAGRAWENADETRMMTKYERRPPAKRVNFSILGIVAPFKYPWLQLLQEWAAIVSPNKALPQEFYVLRCRHVLTELQSLSCSRQRGSKEDLVFNPDCLVGVRLEMTAKGTSPSHSIICLPTSDDINSILSATAKRNCEWSLKESHKLDPIAKERKEQLASVRTLRQKRKKYRLKIRMKKDAGEPDANIQHLQQQLDWAHPKPPLLLPEITQLVKSCDRDIIGFVTVGEFSHSLGKVTSLGFCATSALKKVFELNRLGKSPLVLVRETCSDHYKAAWLSVTLS